ncbi:hypothetical protein BX666DRAFT_1940051 [Dichotomocladium elegans]|nr:hypothetical protein BX666DRAFT_1940051 [Dichotomocladium elegans]
MCSSSIITTMFTCVIVMPTTSLCPKLTNRPVLDESRKRGSLTIQFYTLVKVWKTYQRQRLWRTSFQRVKRRNINGRKFYKLKDNAIGNVVDQQLPP